MKQMHSWRWWTFTAARADTIERGLVRHNKVKILLKINEFTAEMFCINLTKRRIINFHIKQLFSY